MAWKKMDTVPYRLEQIDSRLKGLRKRQETRGYCEYAIAYWEEKRIEALLEKMGCTVIKEE